MPHCRNPPSRSTEDNFFKPPSMLLRKLEFNLTGLKIADLHPPVPVDSEFPAIWRDCKPFKRGIFCRNDAFHLLGRDIPCLNKISRGGTHSLSIRTQLHHIIESISEKISPDIQGSLFLYIPHHDGIPIVQERDFSRSVIALFLPIRGTHCQMCRCVAPI